MRLFAWQKGRLNTGYQKMLLVTARWPIKFDFYLLKFEQGVEVPAHVDRVDSGQHYRLNIILKQAQEGGEFICSQTLYSSRRIKFFRPDLAEHAVSKITRGRRYVLSLGWIKH